MYLSTLQWKNVHPLSSFWCFLNFWTQKHGARRDLGRTLMLLLRPRESQWFAQGSPAVWQLSVLACCPRQLLLDVTLSLVCAGAVCLSRPVLSEAASPGTCLPSLGLSHPCEWRALACPVQCTGCWKLPSGMRKNDFVWGSTFSATQEWNTFHQSSEEKGTAVIGILPWAMVIHYLL